MYWINELYIYYICFYILNVLCIWIMIIVWNRLFLKIICKGIVIEVMVLCENIKYDDCVIRFNIELVSLVVLF